MKIYEILNLQGILHATGDTVKCSSELVRLWMHESTRVYCDKLINEKDIDSFQKILLETVKKGFEVFALLSVVFYSAQ